MGSSGGASLRAVLHRKQGRASARKLEPVRRGGGCSVGCERPWARAGRRRSSRRARSWRRARRCTTPPSSSASASRPPGRQRPEGEAGPHCLRPRRAEPAFGIIPMPTSSARAAGHQGAQPGACRKRAPVPPACRPNSADMPATLPSTPRRAVQRERAGRVTRRHWRYPPGTPTRVSSPGRASPRARRVPARGGDGQAGGGAGALQGAARQLRVALGLRPRDASEPPRPPAHAPAFRPRSSRTEVKVLDALNDLPRPGPSTPRRRAPVEPQAPGRGPARAHTSLRREAAYACSLPGRSTLKDFGNGPG